MPRLLRLASAMRGHFMLPITRSQPRGRYDHTCHLLLLATVWGLWNLHQNLQRLDALVDEWSETLTLLRNADGEQTNPSGKAPGVPPESSELRVIIQITDAVGLAKRYHWAGSAGALAPNVLKKTMQSKVLEQTEASMQEGGHEADVKVIVL